MATCEAEGVCASCGVAKAQLYGLCGTWPDDIHGEEICGSCVDGDPASVADAVRSRRQSPAPGEAGVFLDCEGNRVLPGESMQCKNGGFPPVKLLEVGYKSFRYETRLGHTMCAPISEATLWRRHAPPPEVKPSERAREEGVTGCRYCGSSTDMMGVSCGDGAMSCVGCWEERRSACAYIGMVCSTIEAMRRDFAILHALRPGQTAGDLAAALGEPPPGKR
jgi:hypothetical protein